jgi:large subunit ribosomal protein L9
MQVILLKDVEKVGRKGEIVTVRDGFGRNFLLPRKLASPATPANIAFTEIEKQRASARKTKKKAAAEEVARKLGSVRIQVGVAAGETDKLFGSVTAQDVAEAITEKGFSVEKKQIHLPEPIRSLGTHAVTVELEAGVRATVQVDVVKK